MSNKVKAFLLAVACLVALAFLGTCNTVRSEWPVPPEPKITGVKLSVSMVSDTTLRVILSYGYKVVPTSGAPDSTKTRIGLDSIRTPALKSGVAKWPQMVDTLTMAVSRYGDLSVYGCARPVRRNTPAATETCSTTMFARPDAPPPAYDSTGVKISSIILRPKGAQVDIDSGTVYGIASCRKWQAANPTKSVWITVGLKAVAECMGTNDRPKVYQACVFWETSNGSKGITSSSTDTLMVHGLVAEAQYCDAQFTSWLNEKSL